MTKKTGKPQKEFSPSVKAGNESNNAFLKLAPVLILVFTALLYYKAVFNGFANWDDDGYIIKNPFIKDFSFKGLTAIFSTFYLDNYHPLTTLTYWLEYYFYGLNPLPYHLLNVLLHLANTLLIFKLAEKLSGSKITGMIVSLLFAVHPMHVESVAWIAERKDVLYTLFYLSSLLIYLKYISSGNRKKHYITSLILFLFSLLSKSAAVTLPVLLIIIDFYKGRKITRKVIVEKLPFLFLSLLFGIIALMSQQASIQGHPLSFSAIDRIFLVSYSVIFYPVKLIVPFNLAAMHYYPDTGGSALPWQYYASLPILLTLCLLIYKFRRKTFGKEILFGSMFFIITVSVMLQIIPVGYAIAAERYSYVPYTGLFFIAAQLVSRIEKKTYSKIAMFAVMAVVFAFSLLSWQRIKVWKSGKTIFTDVIKKNPDNYHGYWVRGNVYSHREEPENAIADFTKAAALKPEFADIYLNRAGAYERTGDIGAAFSDYHKAIRVNPNLAEAYNNRADLYRKTGNIADAMADYNKVIQMKPDLSEAYYNRGILYEQNGDTKAALADYTKAVSLNEKFYKAYNNRGLLKANNNDIDGALADINTALTIEPGFAKGYCNRAFIKASKSDFRGAIADFDYSLKLNPADISVYYNRGIARFNMKDTAGACYDWQLASEKGDRDAGALVLKYCK